MLQITTRAARAPERTCTTFLDVEELDGPRHALGLEHCSGGVHVGRDWLPVGCSSER